jgi:hypothetical protein
MEVFYEELAAGSAAPEALRRAQLRVRDNPSTRSPFYWAGFVSIGEGAGAVPLRVRAVSGPMALIWFLALVLAAVLLITLRRLWNRST